MLADVKHLTTAELEAGLDEIRRSPKTPGVLEMIVRRPQSDVREVLDEGQLDPLCGLVGDRWKAPRKWQPEDGGSQFDTQLTIINARLIALVAGAKERWPLAGDQLFIDLDLSEENLPSGTQLSLGSAIIEITAEPHTGCHKFVARYGREAMVFVNSKVGRQLHLRGIYAKVVQQGTVRPGDAVTVLPRER